MLHNDDEIQEFDDCLLEMHSTLNAASIPEIVRGVGDIMRKLCGHDWPEWAPGHGWSVHESEFENVDFDDAEFMKRFVTSAITVLKSGAEKGLPSLQETAAEYLNQRGHEVRTSQRFSKYYWVAIVLKALGKDKDTPMPHSTWQLRRKTLGWHIENHPKSGTKRVRFSRHANESLGLNLAEFRD